MGDDMQHTGDLAGENSEGSLCWVVMRFCEQVSQSVSLHTLEVSGPTPLLLALRRLHRHPHQRQRHRQKHIRHQRQHERQHQRQRPSAPVSSPSTNRRQSASSRLDCWSIFSTALAKNDPIVTGTDSGLLKSGTNAHGLRPWCLVPSLSFNSRPAPHVPEFLGPVFSVLRILKLNNSSYSIGTRYR